MAKPEENKPLMRAQQVLANYRALELFDAKLRAQIRKLIPDPVVAHIERGRAWVPVELDMVLCDEQAVWKVLGDEGLRKYSVDCTRIAAEKSVLSSLLAGAAKLFRPNPGLFITFGPMAWGSIFRHFGEIKVTLHGSHEGEISLLSLPLMAFAHRTYFISLGGCFQA